MKIIGCDLHARQQTLAMLDTETGEIVEIPDSDARRRPRAGILFQISTSGASRDRSHRIDAMVSEPDGRVGNRMPGRSSSKYTGGRATEAETRSARRGFDSEAVGGKPLSFDLAAFEGASGSARLIATPSSVGTDANASAERAAGHCLGKRATARSVAMESSRTRQAGVFCRWPPTRRIDGVSCKPCTRSLRWRSKN